MASFIDADSNYCRFPLSWATTFLLSLPICWLAAFVWFTEFRRWCLFGKCVPTSPPLFTQGTVVKFRNCVATVFTLALVYFEEEQHFYLRTLFPSSASKGRLTDHWVPSLSLLLVGPERGITCLPRQGWTWTLRSRIKPPETSHKVPLWPRPTSRVRA